MNFRVKVDVQKVFLILEKTLIINVQVLIQQFIFSSIFVIYSLRRSCKKIFSMYKAFDYQELAYWNGLQNALKFWL